MSKVLSITTTTLRVPVSHILTLDTLTILTFIVIIQWHPLYQLTTVPLTLLFNIIKVIPDEAHAIFQSVPPLTTVWFGAELPHVRTLAMAFIVIELTCILAWAIKPSQLALAMLFVLFPLSVVLNAIRPRIYTMSIDVIIFKVSSVYATIRTIQYSVAALFPVHELA